MLISLIHPSRGRAKQARKAIDNWNDKCSGEIGIEYILSIDDNDPQFEEYLTETIASNDMKNGDAITVINNNKSVVEATNYAAKKSSGDIIVYMSDDFDCPQNWDKLILEELEIQSSFSDTPKLWCMKVDDNLQKFSVDIITMPIMSRELYLKLRYFFHPEYKSMYVDRDLFHVCKNNGWLINAPYLVFTHNHYSVGRSPHDKTYKESESHWQTGRATYLKRKNLKFPLIG